MLPLRLGIPPGRPLSVLAIGAHPDDIEIGAGGTLLCLAERHAGLRAHYLVLTGTPERQREARTAASGFLAGADLSVQLGGLDEGRLPAAWAQVKDVLEQTAESVKPDLVIAPHADDRHQDHRTIAEVVPTVFRDQLYLGYEIPKWDGDFGRPSLYVPIPPPAFQRKLDLLDACFPSQRHRDWWDREVFAGLARLRGMECRAQYAEAFMCTKALVGL